MIGADQLRTSLERRERQARRDGPVALQGLNLDDLNININGDGGDADGDEAMSNVSSAGVVSNSDGDAESEESALSWYSENSDGSDSTGGARVEHFQSDIITTKLFINFDVVNGDHFTAGHFFPAIQCS